jgi:hypothetical protein
MTTKRRFTGESESEEYLHRQAWSVVLRQIEHAEATPRDVLYDYLVAMVFAFHSLEGYLNFVGDKIAPELWINERESFKDTRLFGKLTAICKCCRISVPDTGRRPYATVAQLKKLRDAMAHPKTRKARGRIEFVEGKPPPLFAKSYLASLVSHEKTLRARDDVKQIADQIHQAAVARFPHAGLGPDALEGIHSTRSTSTRLLTPDDEAPPP